MNPKLKQRRQNHYLILKNHDALATILGDSIADLELKRAMSKALDIARLVNADDSAGREEERLAHAQPHDPGEQLQGGILIAKRQGPHAVFRVFVILVSARGVLDQLQ